MGKNAGAAQGRTGGKANKKALNAAGDQLPASGTEQPDGQTQAVGGAVVVQNSQELSNLVVEGQLQADQISAGGIEAQADQPAETVAAGTGVSDGSSIGEWIASTPGLEVTSKQEGFRRAGRAWSTTPTVIKLSELDEEKARQIAVEPMLSVRPVFIPAEEA